MFWITVLTLILVSALIAYRYRFYTKRKIFGIYPTQFYYLYFVLPITLFSLSRLHDFSSPSLPNFLIIFSFVVIAIGVTLHSFSVSKKTSRVYIFIHGPISHYLIYQGCIFTTICLGLIPENSKLINIFDLGLSILLGFVIGIVGTLSMVRSLYYKSGLISASLGILLLIYAQGNNNLYWVSISSLLTLVILIVLIRIIPRYSKSLGDRINYLIFNQWTS